MKPGEIITMTKEEFEAEIALRNRKFLFEQTSSRSSAIQYQPDESNPREYYHLFLLQAKNAGCQVDSYIDAEVKRMIRELER